MWQIRFKANVSQSFRNKRTTRNRTVLRFKIVVLRVPIDIFSTASLKPHYKTLCGEITLLLKQTISRELSFFNTHSRRSLQSFGQSYLHIHTDFFNILSERKHWYRPSTHVSMFEVNIRPARYFLNSTRCVVNPYTLDWSRNLLYNAM